MPTVKGSFRQAVAAHRAALGYVRAARDALERDPQEPRYGAESVVRQSALAAELQTAAQALVTGWSTAGWDWLAGGRRPLAQRPAGSREPLLRIGTAHPVQEGFPVLVPFFGVGHLCLDTDSTDARVSAFVRSVLLRTLGESTVGSVRVLAVDATPASPTFGPLLPLVEVDLMSRPASDVLGLRAVLAEAEEQLRTAAGSPDPRTLLLAVAAFPEGVTDSDIARLAALSRTGHRAGVQLLLAGYPGPGASWAGRPPLENATVIRLRGRFFHVADPPGHVLSGGGRGLNVPVRLDGGPPEDLLAAVCRQVAGRAAQQRSVEVQELFAGDLWTESSAGGLRTMVGREGREAAWLALDDATPHWLVGGRTGSGRTGFLLGAIYALASRYGPDELALHLLDLSEAVSFAEVAPTAGDPSWVPHVRSLAGEPDRDYGVAVLAALAAELSRRSEAMREVGVTQLEQLRAARPDLALPRIVTVIDGFDALLSGADATARQARTLLTDVARRGRAHGVHLILAGQTSAAVQGLLAEDAALFGPFTLRIALAGGGPVLGRPDDEAAALPVGTALVENQSEAAGSHHRIRFPAPRPEPIARLRQRMWEQRVPGDHPPAVFTAAAARNPQDDPAWQALTPQIRRRSLLLGRAVDVGMPTAAFPLDTSPGRHLAVLGPAETGADLLALAVTGLARQHAPGTAAFLLAGLVAVADPAVDAAAAAVREAGHRCSEVEVTGLRAALSRIAHPEPEPFDPASLEPGALPAAPTTTYLVVWGADGLATGLSGAVDPRWGSTGLQDLHTALQDGPARGAHLISWWRSARRFAEDLGPQARDGVAGLVTLNVTAAELAELAGEESVRTPRPDRALLIDRHQGTTTPFIPYRRSGSGRAGRP
ncbi:MAG TPA: FtsK/SpoIIIE domain-containing protein [Kineosporiaceae bacterium]|nr:FtsK/SpoIIIE domain-containing protein [Kineosporiaceae bacterium]